jgi:hypothetical protein
MSCYGALCYTSTPHPALLWYFPGVEHMGNELTQGWSDIGALGHLYPSISWQLVSKPNVYYCCMKLEMEDIRTSG